MRYDIVNLQKDGVMTTFLECVSIYYSYIMQINLCKKSDQHFRKIQVMPNFGTIILCVTELSGAQAYK